MHPFTPGTFRTMYPSGRSYLFDMGAGHWDEGSLTWFITVWGRRGVVFDEIYGARTSPAAYLSRQCGRIYCERPNRSWGKLCAAHDYVHWFCIGCKYHVRQ